MSLARITAILLMTLSMKIAAGANDDVMGAACVVATAGKEKTGSALDMHDLPGGGVLIGADEGLFRYDPATGLVAAAGKEKTGGVREVDDLSGGGVLIGPDEGLFRYDSATGLVAPAGKELTGGSVRGMHDLPGGGVLIGAEAGWFVAPSMPLPRAVVKPLTNLQDRAAPSKNRISAKLH